ncbi:unnamed protein product [Moneuplotes crassus]|uniref:Uncharacterized protein n=1 Tax=Euplotes crassus TaxID=5936 RepID=A0AAD1Y3W3_EUPCR|nr:unnamed protein product [Moneuplotes crassus]
MLVSEDTKSRSSDLTFKEIMTVCTTFDFMLNKNLLVEYLEWLLAHHKYAIIEALFFQFFLEFVDTCSYKDEQRQKRLMRIIKLKELVAIVLVKGQYHNIIHYLIANKYDHNLTKEFRRKNPPTKSLKSVSTVSNFKPLLQMNYNQLRECIEFSVQYFKQIETGEKEQLISKQIMLYCLLCDTKLAEKSDQILKMLSNVFKSTEKFEANFSYEELTKILEDYQELSKVLRESKAAKNAENEELKIVITQFDEHKLDLDGNRLPNVARYFFEAIGYLQSFNFKKSEYLFQKLIVMILKQESSQKEADNFNVKIYCDSIHFVNVIKLINLRSKAYSTHDLRKALLETSKIFMQYPYPDLYIKIPSEYRKVEGFSEMSLFDLIINCVHNFLRYPIEENKNLEGVHRKLIKKFLKNLIAHLSSSKKGKNPVIVKMNKTYTGMLTFLCGVYDSPVNRIDHLNKDFKRVEHKEYNLLFEGAQDYIHLLKKSKLAGVNLGIPKSRVASEQQSKGEEDSKQEGEKKSKTSSNKLLSLCMSIKKHCEELKHVLSKADKNYCREIPRSSKLQRLNIECSIINSFMKNKSRKSALKYFLEFEDTAISDWSWIEEISKRSMKTMFQTETIHQISDCILALSNPFEASLIYQICNIKDTVVKENIGKSIINYYAVNTSLLGDETLVSSTALDNLERDLNSALEYVWSIDYLSQLVICLNSTKKSIAKKNAMKSVKNKMAALSDHSRHASDIEMTLEKKTSRSPQSGKNSDSSYSNSIKKLIERMEALDLEEEEFFQKEPSAPDEKWVAKYRSKLRLHLISLVNKTS